MAELAGQQSATTRSNESDQMSLVGHKVLMFQANNEARDEKGYIEARDEKGRTALLWASEKGNVESIMALIENGANEDARDKVLSEFIY